jgi:phosphohistidine phosphatase SixA
VLILLVRHGHAGTKAAWRDDDRLRPLSRRGHAEADALVDLLVPFEPARVVTSPVVRCRQTVEPLATRLHLAIEETTLLAPDATDVAALLDYLTRAPAPLVACTHGEVIEAVQEQLASVGAVSFGDDRPRDKGSVWVLHAARRRIIRAEYLPPGAQAGTAAQPRSRSRSRSRA